MYRNGIDTYLQSLLTELRHLPTEIEWVEFKQNYQDYEGLGEYIAALANSAALCGKTYAYLVWGIHDQTHEIVGTQFKYRRTKKGNEELESWLLRLLTPKIEFRFFELLADDKPVVILEINRANHEPVKFKGTTLIRIGSYKKRLKDYPEKERELWRLFDKTPFEHQIAINNLNADQVLNCLDYPAYFDLTAQNLPSHKNGILQQLVAEKMIRKNQAGQWDVYNLGAILFAKDLAFFPELRHKAIRIIQYANSSRTETVREREEKRGYATSFFQVIDFINILLPTREIITPKGQRKDRPMYPPTVIWELVANMLIHQDFSLKGTSPMVEIFDRRIEITNTGQPLVDPRRFLDTPPQSRNEALAAFLRRIEVCEERGSGIDKIMQAVETHHSPLPAPQFEVLEKHTRVTLSASKTFAKMSREERVITCYFHACLKQINKSYMTRLSLRQRLHCSDNAAKQVIAQTSEKSLLRLANPEVKRNFQYLPYWA
ncbi:MAG: putative DNA binding domain-containing protein [Thiomargarita sp.]|nr:putative DNA binding domain-containing protein [Thiomargarita sp.]